MKTTQIARCLCAVTVPTAASIAFAAGQAVPAPAATSATVTAVDRTDFVPVFRAEAFVADDIMVPPTHPPIDLIPPMPMPNPDFDLPDRLGGPGNVLHYDVETRQITEIEVPWANRGEGEGFGGGWVGADGEFGFDDMFATRGFGTMSSLSDALIQIHPYRMNTKMVMEYVDAGNGSAIYYVCSAGMQDAEVVLTAGHCVYNRDNDSTGNDYGFADRIWVYPGWDGNGLTLGVPDELEYYGWGQSDGMFAWTGWTVDGNFDWDMACVSVSRAVGMLTGWYGWRFGGACDTLTYNNGSFPSESCGSPGLHNGRDMYFWSGSFDSCPGNQMHLNTTPGCFTAVWGGMSGSNAYDIDAGNRYAHGVCSNSNRSTSGNYTKMWEDHKNYMENTFKPGARGAAFDIQSLQTRYAESTVLAGNQLTGGSAQMPNPTNANPPSDNYGITVYLSSNNNISTSDTVIGSGSYTYDYAAMQNVNLNMFNVTVPKNTPSGNYWVGVHLNLGEDTNDNNNDPDLWDAHNVTVTGIADIVANTCTAPNGTFYHGDTINVAYNVTNEGGDPSNSVTLDVYASTNTDISTLDTFLGTVNIGTFSGSQTKSGSLNVQLPSSLVGNYYIGYIASASDDYYVNQDNEAYDSTAITIAGRADLLANYIDRLEPSVYQGGELDVRFNVQNFGTVASGAYTVEVRASPNTIISTADTLLGTFNRPSIGVGGSSTLVAPVDIPGFIAPGNYYIGMIVSGGVNENVFGDNTNYDPNTVSILDCLVDFDSNGLLDLADIVFFVTEFNNNNPAVDFDNNNLWDLNDIVAFVQLFTAGCP